MYILGNKSPVLQKSFFTPIQPAPALLSAAANAHAVQTNNIANIIQKQREQKLEENLKEVSCWYFLFSMSDTPLFLEIIQTLLDFNFMKFHQ